MRELVVFFTGMFAMLCSACGQEKILSLQTGAAKDFISVTLPTGNYALLDPVPVISYQVGEGNFTATNGSPALSFGFEMQAPQEDAFHLVLHFKNVSRDTIRLHNVHPFSRQTSEALITGVGNHPLSRTHLFLPGKRPVNVIVPDNAWDLGYAAVGVNDSIRLAALTRRISQSITQGERRRFETILYPGGTVDFNLFILTYAGKWQAGLTRIFQEKMLFDIGRFDDALFRRKDLQWIRHSYVMHLMDAWDKFYYDVADGKYHLQDFLQRGRQLYGGDDVVSVWPTWPTLGLDQRNQFDLFDDLPGGIAAMKRQAGISHVLGTRFFVCYNPWDEGTDSVDHYEGITKLLRSTDADGIVLDTKAEAGKVLQDAADKSKPGIIMYSEGMAVPKDMEGIVSGRVHNALYYPPMLNLNKLIRPEFAIFRVAELFKERIRREFATSFFNGYGTEINIMAPGQPDWVLEQYRFLGNTTRILRENTDNFTNRGYTPLVSTRSDSIWVNEWKHTGKTIFTIYSIIPQGYKGNLVKVVPSEKTHFVDLWHHRLLTPVREGNDWYVPAQTAAFDSADLGTNNEGAVDCIAQLPRILSASINEDVLQVCASAAGGEVRVWAGAPAYDKKPLTLKSLCEAVELQKHFGRFEGDFVVQYVKAGILQDETVVTVVPGTPRRVSRSVRTVSRESNRGDMVKIPAGSFVLHHTNGDEFIPYPKQHEGDTIAMPSFSIDRFPVTNKQFEIFIRQQNTGRLIPLIF